MKNPPTAIKDSVARLLRPTIPCPDVQPPAYRAPKPTNKPAPNSIRNPLRVNKVSRLNISSGKYCAPAFLIPILIFTGVILLDYSSDILDDRGTVVNSNSMKNIDGDTLIRSL